MNISEKRYYIFDTLFHLLVSTLFFYKAVNENHYYWILVSAFSEYKLGLIAHEGCHKAIDRTYGYIYDLFLGSSEQWIQKHNKGHHLEVNKKTDPDVQLMPLLRIRQDQNLYFYHSFQQWYQYLLFIFAALPLRLNGVYYIFSKKRGLDLYRQFLIWSPGLSLFLAYPIFMYGIPGIVFWLLQNAIIGFLYGIIFSVSHVNEKSYFNDTETNFSIMQLDETADWSAGSTFWNYMTGGLNHQVIHHLYPHKSSYHYPSMVKNVITKYGEKYHRYDNLPKIIASNWRFMKKLSNRKLIQ